MEFQLVNLTITFLLTGLASGLIAGLLGVGGGIISVPISYFILLNLGYSIDVVMHVAIASSLGTIVFTSISSIRSHINLQNVEISVIKKWAPGIIFGSIIGSISASKIHGEILVSIFICLAFLISINMFFQKKIIIFANDLPQSHSINFITSGVIGFFSVLIGIGGGSFSVPTLSAYSKPMHRAVGTSAVIGFFIALPAAITYIFTGRDILNLPPYSFGYVNVLIVLLISSTSVFTAHFGAKLSSKTKTTTLKKIFAVFLLCTCISLIVEHFVF